MTYKITFLAGLGLGYVLGTRAGRQRYESIMRTAHRVAEHPTVQSTAGVLQAQAGGVLSSVRERLGGAGHQPDGESRWWEYEEASTGEERA
ncbi:MAG TPA: hypothetical protein VFX70_14345 [Mycobacteriales bacterium]|nr:hypothetical protein [Mycobacteriales bacterium]